MHDFKGAVLESDLTPKEGIKLWATACIDLHLRDPEDLRRFLIQVHLDQRKSL
ncbi:MULTISPECIES: hypothetical protein [unclassified Methylobacterium]|uniref:hypothetical protein n=1 Tax=unclassified Methylobacterium TaxID=2615210 RepID=UPI0016504B5F|nr:MULTISPECIES: hypothetical protein [unclassified Methylobacterium]